MSEAARSLFESSRRPTFFISLANGRAQNELRQSLECRVTSQMFLYFLSSEVQTYRNGGGGLGFLIHGPVWPRPRVHSTLGRLAKYAYLENENSILIPLPTGPEI